MQRADTWATLQLIPQFEEPEYDDYYGSELETYSSAVAWAYLERTQGWYQDSASGTKIWRIQYWVEPALKINLSPLRAVRHRNLP